MPKCVFKFYEMDTRWLGYRLNVHFMSCPAFVVDASKKFWGLFKLASLTNYGDE